MIYTTLKANKEHGIDGLDIAITYDECYGEVSDLFEEDTFDEVVENHTPSQIGSTVLKALKADAKNLEMQLLNWTTHKVFIDIDAPEIAFMQVEKLIKDGVITGSSDLKELDQKTRKRGCTIRKEVCYDEINHYYTMKYIDDLIDEHFPCEFTDEFGCTDCGNCQ